MPGLIAEDSDSFSNNIYAVRSVVSTVLLQDQNSIEEHLGIDIWNFPMSTSPLMQGYEHGIFLIPTATTRIISLSMARR